MTFDPGSAEATGLMVELLGDAAWHGSRDEDSLHEIAATLRLEPIHAALARELVFGLARRGRVAEVVEAAPFAIFIEPGLAVAHAMLGRALAEKGQPAAAVASLERALALGEGGEDQVEIRRLLAALYRRLNLNPSGRPPPPPTAAPAPSLRTAPSESP